MTNKVVWNSPAPSSGFLNDAEFKELHKRECQVSFRYEDDQTQSIRHVILSFINIAAFRCTYLPALSVEMIETSYDKLIDIESSDWLTEAVESMKSSGFDYR